MRQKRILLVIASILWLLPGAADSTEINSTVPQKNEINASTTTNVSARFDTVMSAASLNDTTFIIIGFHGGKASGVYWMTDGDSTAVFDPDLDFYAGEVVEAIVTTDVRSAVGVPMDSSYVWRFTVEAVDNGDSLQVNALWESSTGWGSGGLAWGDYDGDGDLDLICGNTNITNTIFRNDGGVLTTTPVWSSTPTKSTRDIAVGDYDGDGDIDLACGNQGDVNTMYRNDGGVLTTTPVWSSTPTNETYSIACGDYDGDGDLDLACGNFGQPNTVYRNEGGTLTATPVWSSTATNNTYAVSWGDYDGDGDLDLACGNTSQSNTVYRNDGGTLTVTPVWSSVPLNVTLAIEWGDYDGDGDLDLACGNSAGSNTVYRNDGGVLTATPVWSSTPTNNTYAVSWGDYDGDGDLDLACGNTSQPNMVYRNDGGVLTATPTWSSTATYLTKSVAWGDIDGDGDLELAFGNTDPDPNTVYGNIVVADLSITSFISTAGIYRGYDPVTALVQISNAGDAATGTFRVTLRISADTVMTTDDIVLDAVYVSNIDVGFDTTVSIAATLPKAAPRGDVYLGVMVDDLDHVAEYNEGDNTAFNAFSYQVPVIYAVRDMPYDQGGYVYLSWYASALDLPAGGGLITQYSIWRAISATAARLMMESEETVVVRSGQPIPQRMGDIIRIELIADQMFFWHPIDTTGAYHIESYGYPEPTIFDSTGTDWEYNYFQVIAHTDDELVFYISGPDSGYSVDNLAPEMPKNLAGKQTEPEQLQLTWDPNTEPDLSHYAVYRGTDDGFTPELGNLIGEPVNPGLFDNEWRWSEGYYYKVAAIDVNGNVSVFASLAPDLVVGVKETGPPKISYLAHCRPNPFGLQTQIAFGLAQDANVSIRIFDVKGRLVRILLDEHRKADHHSVIWDGRDGSGRVVASGIYFYRLTAGSFVQTKKLTLLR